MYTSACIEEEMIGRTLYHTDSKDGSHSQSCNDEGHAFYSQLDQWGVEKLFQNSDEAITRELKFYIEEWGNCISRTRAKYQKSCLLKIMVVWIYMMKIWKQIIIYHEILQFDKTDGWKLIGISEKEDGTFSDHVFFSIMMIYLIESNQLIKIEISCSGLYKMSQTKKNLGVKQHRYTMTISKKRRGLLTNIQPIILLREICKKQLTIGRKNLMTSG